MIEKFILISRYIVSCLIAVGQFIIINNFFLAYVIERLSTILPEKYAKLKLMVILYFFCFLLGVILKDNFYADKYVLVLLGVLVIINFIKFLSSFLENRCAVFKRINNLQTNEICNAQVRSYIVGLIIFSLLFVVMFIGTVSVTIRYPYKLQGKIKDVFVSTQHIKTGKGPIKHWNVSYIINDATGTITDDNLYVGEYELIYAFTPSIFRDDDVTKQHYRGMKGESIKVCSKYDNCLGELISLNEIYTLIYICFILLSYIIYIAYILFLRNKLIMGNNEKKLV